MRKAGIPILEKSEYTPPRLVQTEDGTLLQTEGTRPALVPNARPDDPEPLMKAMSQMEAGTGLAVQRIATAAETYHAARMPERAFSIWIETCRTSFTCAVSALVGWQRDLAAYRVELVGHAPSNSPLASSLAAWWLGQDVTSVMSRVPVAEATALNVLLSLRGLIDLPDDLWQTIETRFIVASTMNGERPAIATMFMRKPSLEDPTATGVEAAAVERFAQDALAAQDRHAERIDHIAASLQGLCAMIASSTEKSPHVVWDALTAG